MEGIPDHPKLKAALTMISTWSPTIGYFALTPNSVRLIVADASNPIAGSPVNGFVPAAIKSTRKPTRLVTPCNVKSPLNTACLSLTRSRPRPTSVMLGNLSASNHSGLLNSSSRCSLFVFTCLVGTLTLSEVASGDADQFRAGLSDRKILPNNR